MGVQANSSDFDDDLTAEHAHLMLEFYCKTLQGLGFHAEPYPDVDEHLGERRLSTPRFETLCHAAWMCDQCRIFLRGRRLAKAYRWLGTIQGILFMNGVFSIMELKDHNRFDLPPVTRKQGSQAFFAPKGGRPEAE